MSVMGGKHDARQQHHTHKPAVAPKIGMDHCMIRGEACAGDGSGVGAYNSVHSSACERRPIRSLQQATARQLRAVRPVPAFLTALAGLHFVSSPPASYCAYMRQKWPQGSDRARIVRRHDDETGGVWRIA